MKQGSRQLDVGGLSVELVRKRIKNINLSVRGQEGRVRVSAPLRTSEREIRRFVESRLDWIRQHQTRLAALPEAQTLQYKNGELHVFLGRSYRLQVDEQSPRAAAARLNGDDVLQLQVPRRASAAQRQALLEAWYREQLCLLIPPLIARYEPIMGVRVAEWRIRKMKTRWGTCNIKARRIWINLELAKLPPDCLEHIVVHEMVHLLERGHNTRFYGFMDQFLPDWRQGRDVLRRHALS